MKKLISVRLEEADYARLLKEAKSFGGVGKWITSQLSGYVYIESKEKIPDKIIKTRQDAVEAAKDLASKVLKKVSHSPGCKCLMCKPPKAK